MSKLENGGPAFPTTKPLDGWGGPKAGMSLRDYFAGQALSMYARDESYMARLRDSSRNLDLDLNEMLARNAYLAADAMLKERER